MAVEDVGGISTWPLHVAPHLFSSLLCLLHDPLQLLGADDLLGGADVDAFLLDTALHDQLHLVLEGLVAHVGVVHVAPGEHLGQGRVAHLVELRALLQVLHST